jgi:hypothetical protein
VAWKIADLFVQFAVQGVDGVKNALGATTTQLAGVQTAITTVGTAADASFGKAAAAAQAAAAKITTTTKAATGAVATAAAGVDRAVGATGRAAQAAFGQVGTVAQTAAGRVVQAGQVVASGWQASMTRASAAASAAWTSFQGTMPNTAAAVSAAGRAVGSTLAGVGSAAQAMGGAIVRAVQQLPAALQAAQAGLEKLRSGAAAVGSVMGRTFGVGILALGGWVTAGVAASSAGQMLSFQIERLARSVAGLFAPEINKLIELIGQLTDWINSLTPAQKEMIVRFVEGAAAALAVAKVAPMLIGAIGGVIGAVQMLAGAFLELDVETGGILPVIGAIVTGLAALAIGTEVGRNGLGKLMEGIKPIADAFQQLLGAAIEGLTPILEAVSAAFGAVAEGLQPLFAALSQVATVIGGALKQALDKLIPTALDMVSVWIETVQALVPLLEPIGALIGALVKAGAAVFRVANVFNMLIAVVVARVLPPLVKLVAAFMPLVTVIVELVGTIAEALAPVLEAIAGLFVKLVELAVPVIQFFADLAKTIVDFVVGAVRLAITWINKLIDALNQLPGFNLKKIEVPQLKAPEPDKKGGRNQLGPQIGSFTDPAEVYKTIAQASLRVGAPGKSDAEKHTELLQNIDNNGKKQNEKLDKIKPAWQQGG